MFAFFPPVTPMTLITMNWFILIYGAVMAYAFRYFLLFGRRVYEGPVVLVKPIERCRIMASCALAQHGSWPLRLWPKKAVY